MGLKDAAAKNFFGRPDVVASILDFVMYEGSTSQLRERIVAKLKGLLQTTGATAPEPPPPPRAAPKPPLPLRAAPKPPLPPRAAPEPPTQGVRGAQPPVVCMEATP